MEGRKREGGRGKRGMGREEAGSPPKLKLGPPRTIFLAPALATCLVLFQISLSSYQLSN